MQQASFIQDGNRLDLVAPVDLAAGEVLIQGDLAGVSNRNTPAGDLGSLTVVGIFGIHRAPGGPAIPAGSPIYWDATTKGATPDAAGGANKRLGLSVDESPASALVVRVHLNF